YLRALAADLIGPDAGPAGEVGFEITAATGVARDFRIGAGRYYVDGILCELEQTPVPVIVKTSAPKNQVTVPTGFVDGLAFQSGQYVEVFSAATSVLAKITAVTIVDPTQQILALDTDAPTVTAGAGPAVRRIITYLTQLDYTVPNVENLVPNTRYQVYLD